MSPQTFPWEQEEDRVEEDPDTSSCVATEAAEPHLPARVQDVHPTSWRGLEQILSEVTQGAMIKAMPNLEQAASHYANQYIAAVLSGKDPSLLPEIVVPTRSGKDVRLSSSKEDSWKSFLTGLGIDAGAAVVGVLGEVGDIDLLSSAGWITLGALVGKTLIQTVIGYFGGAKFKLNGADRLTRALGRSKGD